MLNLARLRVLEAAARTGSLTAAAAELSYTTSAVSQRRAAPLRILPDRQRRPDAEGGGRVRAAAPAGRAAALGARPRRRARRRGRPRAGPGAGLRVLAGAGRRARGRRGARAAAGPRLHHDAGVAPAGATAAVAARRARAP